ncbi:MAG: hypothetical protein EA409_08895 [Saprospirales bacterium]|nr:MAG: hypothetical protein EA409_08895 [Saprospirales bacterium]
MVSDTFFWIQSELPQGLAVMFLYYGLLLKKGNNPTFETLRNCFSLILLFVLVFAHPLLIFPVVFLGLYFSYSNGWTSRVSVYTAAFLGMSVLKTLFIKTGYDSQAMSGLRNFKRFFPDYFSLNTQTDFLWWLLTDYYLLALGFGLLVYLLLKYKKTIPLFFYLTFFLAYSFLINVSYASTGAEKFYLENMYLPLGVMTLIPLVDLLSAKRMFAKHLVIAIALIFALRIGAIISRSEFYCDRVQYLLELIEDQRAAGQDKTILPESEVNMDLIMLSWGSSYEVWLLSTMDGSSTHSMLIVNDPETFVQSRDLGNSNVFFTLWATYYYDHLPPNYFNFDNRNDTYRILPSTD